MKKIFLMFALCGILCAGAVGGVFSLGKSYVTKNPDSYRAALTSLVDDLNKGNFNDRKIKAPKYLRKMVKKDEKKEIKKEKERALKVISTRIKQYGELHKKGVCDILRSNVSNVDNATVTKIFNGEIYMSDYLEKRIFNKLESPINPVVTALTNDVEFMKSYKIVAGKIPTKTELNLELRKEIFRALKKAEKSLFKAVSVIS